MWTQVDGADSYLLLRDEGSVVYSGPDSASEISTVTVSTLSTVVFSLSADKASKDDLLGTANDLPLG